MVDCRPARLCTFYGKCRGHSNQLLHGCVFALRNKKPFVCETTPYRSIKVQGLMEKVGGEKHLVSEDTPTSIYTSQLSELLEASITQRIAQLRQSSNAYLEQALSIKQLQIA